jgi:lipopolysaccharide transport system permease protein
VLDKTVSYIKYLFKTRYFWGYLAKNDIIARNRRSKLGMLWLMVQPLLMTAILAVVFGTVFHKSIIVFAPYVYIGTTIWEVLTQSAVGGGGAFQAAAPYIKQYNHRKTIFTLRFSVVTIVSFLIAEIGIFLWVAIAAPRNLLIGLATFPLTTVLLFLLAWAITTIAAYINVKFRDYQRVMQIVMQALWYFSPVFMEEDIFSGSPWQRIVYNCNPITHILLLQRKPMLQGIMPSGTDYLYVIGSISVLGLIAWVIDRRYEKSVIYYL